MLIQSYGHNGSLSDPNILCMEGPCNLLQLISHPDVGDAPCDDIQIANTFERFSDGFFLKKQEFENSLKGTT